MKIFKQLRTELTEARYYQAPRTVIKKQLNDDNMRHSHEGNEHIVHWGSSELGRAKFGDHEAIKSLADKVVKYGTHQGGNFYPHKNIGGVTFGGSGKGVEHDSNAIVNKIKATEPTNEEYDLDESGNPFKRADDVIVKIRNKAAIANLKGDKDKEEKYSKRLTKVMSVRNKLATESLEKN